MGASDLIDLLVNGAYLVGGILVLLGGILALKAERKLPGVLLMLGGVMVAVEMLVWTADMAISYVRTGSTWEGSAISEGLYYPVVLTGVLGTLLAGVGVVVLALLVRAAHAEIGNLRRVADGAGGRGVFGPGGASGIPDVAIVRK